MSDNDIWRLSATDLAKQTRSKQISAVEAVQSSIDRLHQVNPALNAVVEDLSTEALTHAHTLDQAVAAGTEPGPLHGVPVTIKINVDQKGHATTNGVVALKDVIAPDDGVLATGSGGPFAAAAAKALMSHTDLPTAEVVRAALGIAAEIDIYSNDQLTVLETPGSGS